TGNSGKTGRNRRHLHRNGRTQPAMGRSVEPDFPGGFERKRQRRMAAHSAAQPVVEFVVCASRTGWKSVLPDRAEVKTHLQTDRFADERRRQQKEQKGQKRQESCPFCPFCFFCRQSVSYPNCSKCEKCLDMSGQRCNYENAGMNFTQTGIGISVTV